MFKNKNVLYIIYEIYFYQKVMSLQILKITVYLQSRKIRVYIYVEQVSHNQKEKKKAYKKLLEQGENITLKHNVNRDENT